MEQLFYVSPGSSKYIRKAFAVFAAILAFVTLWLAFISLNVFELKKHEIAYVKSELSCHSTIPGMVGLDSLGSKEVNDDLVLALMKEMEVQHPHFVLAQMKLESGNYQSMLTKTNNNYFGMRHPLQRMTVSLGSKNGYAKYRNWAFSVLDYALWQKRYAWCLSEQEYLQKLGSVYAEDSEYISKIQNISKGLQML